MTIVLPTALSVDAYSAAGREVEIPRPDCPDCSDPMVFWSGYERSVRDAGRCLKIWVARGRCSPCSTTHALLPAFCLTNRLDTAETIGTVIEAAIGGPDGVRPAAAAAGEIPHTTARGWVRRFAAKAARLAAAFAALCVELGGPAPSLSGRPGPDALAALNAAWLAASALPGWLLIALWRFASSSCRGSLIAANTNPPWFIVGNRRFMPPVP